MATPFAETKCGKSAKLAAEGLLESRDLNELFARIDANSTRQSIEEAVTSAVQEIKSIAEREALGAKRTMLFNGLRVKNLVIQASRYKDPADFFLSITLGGEKGSSARDNAASFSEGWLKGEIGHVYDALRKEGLWSGFKSGAWDESIAWAMWHQSASPEMINRTPGAKEALAGVPSEAKRIADLLHAQSKSSLEQESVMGAFRAWKEGFILSQSHNQASIRKASNPTGIDVWNHSRPDDRRAYLQDLREWIDMEGTLKNLVRVGRLAPESLPPTVREKLSIVGVSGPPSSFFDEDDFLRSLWEVFTTGVRMNPDGTTAAHSNGNVAARAEQSRILEFKSPATWVAYNQKYGTGSVIESWQNQLRDSAHTIATLRYFGPSAKDNFDKAKSLTLASLRKEMGEASRAEDSGESPARSERAVAASIRRLSENPSIDSYFSRYMGENSAPGSLTLAQASSFWMSLQRMSKLGGAVIASLTDPFTQFASLQIEGVPMGRALLSPFFSTIERLGKEELNGFLRQTGIGLETMLGSVAARIDGVDLSPGKKMDRLQSFFFRATGLAGWTDLLKTNYVYRLSNEYAENTHLAWSSLPEAIRSHFERYNIGSSEWDVIRKHGVGQFSGYKILAPDLISGATDASLSEVLKAGGINPTTRAIKEARIGLEGKLRNLFIDGADYASVTPDKKTQEMLSFGQRPGTPAGEFLRLTLQFKSFPVAFMHKMLGRFLHARGAVGVGQILAGMTAMGTVVFLINEWRKGRGMPDPDEMEPADWTKLLLAGFVQGGGAGVFTDLIFQQGYLSGRSDQGSLLGPTGDTLAKPIEMLWKSAIKGEDVGDDFVRYAQGNIPGANIWWAKPLLDHYVFNNLIELANPGSLRRMEQRAAAAGRPYDPNHPFAGILLPSSSED